MLPNCSTGLAAFKSSWCACDALFRALAIAASTSSLHHTGPFVIVVPDRCLLSSCLNSSLFYCVFYPLSSHCHVSSFVMLFMFVLCCCFSLYIYTYFPHDIVWTHGSSSGQCCLSEDIKRLDVMRQVFVISTSYSVILLKSHFIIGLPLYI